MNLRSFHNTHKDQTCVIIGNGPSLRDIPLEFLRKYPTFGTNKIYSYFFPTYYVAVNRLVIEQNLADIACLKMPCFLKAGYLEDHENVVLLNCINKRDFSTHADVWVYEGHTVTFVALQVAWYMGFKTVLLVGIDHDYVFEGKPNELNFMEGEDPNHFDPNYFKGQKWHNPDLRRSEEAYISADFAYKFSSRKIWNLSTKTKLDVFETGDYKQWM